MYEKILSTVLLNVGVQKGNAYVHQASTVEYESVKSAPQTADSNGFGVLEVACWLLVPKFAGSHPVEAVGFLGRKNPQHPFLRRGSKDVGPMS
jgi:hypothetical protein